VKDQGYAELLVGCCKGKGKKKTSAVHPLVEQRYFID